MDARTHVFVLSLPFIVAFIVTACGGAAALDPNATPKPVNVADDIKVYTDQARGVVCYIFNHGYYGGDGLRETGSISCVKLGDQP